MTAVAQVPKVRDDEGVALVSCCTGSYAGHVLRSLELLPASTPKAVVFFAHGTFQHSRSVELRDLQQLMLSKGCAWFGLDAPGHGMSGRLGDASHVLAPALVPDVDAFLSDLLFFIRLIDQSVINNASLPDVHVATLPVVLMAHSWGCALLTMLLPQLQDELGPRLRGVCFSSCTALPPQMPDPRMPSFTEWCQLQVMAMVAPEECPTKAGKQNLSPSSVARDPALRELMMNDKLRYLAGERPYLSSLSWTKADIYKRAGRVVPRVTVPLCLVTGAADKAVSPLCGLNMYCESRTSVACKSFHLVPDAAHNLFADPERGVLIEEWSAFVTKAIDGAFLS